MKRFHVHVHVADLAASVRFYSTLFGAEPTVTKPDYAKWMVEDPRLNFAISTRAGTSPGIDHLGVQVDSEEELGAMRAAVDRAAAPVLEEHGITCCYAKSDKHWVTDPQGVAWETFRTLGTAPTYHGEAARARACCAPADVAKPASASPRCCG